MSYQGTDRRKTPKYNLKITAKKALKQAAVGAGTAGVVAAVAAVADPQVAAQIVSAVGVLLPPPWDVLATIGLPALFAGVTKAVSDWGGRAPKSPVTLGKKALEAARAKAIANR